MPVLDELRRLSSAEEFFAFLGVPFDPAVVRVSRLHILRRMGLSLAGADLAGLSEPGQREACRRALEEAYASLLAKAPLEQRLFKVHQQAGGLVPLGRQGG
jgi:nitrogenase-stabilizing/protective protein